MHHLDESSVHARLRSELAAALEQNQQLESRIGVLEASVEHWQKRYAGQQTRLQQLDRELRLVFGTRSWKLTAPLRAAQAQLARSRSRTFLHAMALGRSHLPGPAKDVLGRLFGWESPPRPAHLFGPPVPVAPQLRDQEPWPSDLPLVTVVIPCFNYGHYVRDAIESVRQQTLGVVEAIVVDDGSTEAETVRALKELEAEGVAVLWLKNGGLPAARNAGIAIARGKYICCLDADDTIEPTYLEKAVCSLEANPGVGFVYPWARLFGDEVGVWHTEPFDLGRLLRYNHVAVAGVFARSTWALVGGYADDMRLGFEDWEFWIRVGSRGLRGQLIPEALFNHRRHGRTMTQRAVDRADEIVADIRARHATLYADPGAIEALQSGYSDGLVRHPFRNVAHSLPRRGQGTSGHLLVLAPWLPVGGAEAVLHDVLEGVQDANLAQCSVVTSLASTNDWHDRFYALTKSIYHLPNFLPPYAWDDFLLGFADSQAVDTVLVSASEFGYSTLPKLRQHFPSLRIVNLLHNDSPEGYMRQSARYEREIDVHVVVGTHIAGALAHSGRVPPGKIRIACNGVDVDERFNPARHQRGEARQRFELPANARVVSFVGRLSPEKQPDVFVGLADRLREIPNLVFVLVGEGSLHHTIEADISRLGLSRKVAWIPGLAPEEVPCILAASDLLTITSSGEGFPLCMLEALAMGVPVVSFDVGGVTAAVHNDVNGCVVPAGDISSLANAVAGLLDNPAELERLRRNARTSILQAGYTRDSMLATYREILARR